MSLDRWANSDGSRAEERRQLRRRAIKRKSTNGQRAEADEPIGSIVNHGPTIHLEFFLQYRVASRWLDSQRRNSSDRFGD